MNIAVFCPNWIGDVVMATPAIAALRRHYATARFIGVMRPYVAGVLEGESWFDEVLYAGGSWRHSLADVGWRLRRRRVDLAVLFPNSFRAALCAWLGGCRRIVGYARDGRTLLLTDAVPPRRNADGRFTISPVIDAYNALAHHLGAPWPGYRMHLATTERDEEHRRRVWQHYGLHDAKVVVALNPGAAYGAAKQWPTESFAKLAQLWLDGERAKVLVLCGPTESARAREIVTRTNRPGMHSLAGEPVSIGLLKACVRWADLLVSTDSGPRHFAAAFDRPVATLFGPTHTGWTETYHPKSLALQVQVPCGPCQLRVCPLDHRCMTELTPERVFTASLSLWNRWRGVAGARAQGRPPLWPWGRKRVS